MLVNVPKSFFVRIVKATQILLKLSIIGNSHETLKTKDIAWIFFTKVNHV